MLLAKATLVAGPKHPKYPEGTRLSAVFFVDVDSDDDLDRVASAELGERRWARMSIERIKTIDDPGQFLGLETVIASAHRDAVESGFGIVVYPEVGV